jgi:opacity protein-like surface antigen
MINLKLFGVAAVLSAAIASPVLAQAVVQEPGAYAFYHPNGDLGIGTGASGSAGAMASARTSNSYASAPAKHYARSSPKHDARTQAVSAK